MKFIFTGFLGFLWAAGNLPAQSPSVLLTSAVLTSGTGSADSYSIQGSFKGLAFSSAQVVVLSVGQYQTFLLATDFVQQPDSNIWIYQDSTGQAPYWLSSLNLDLDAQTFNAQATGTALAGLTNPFAVRLGTESATACTMARVSSADGTNFQLNAADGVNEPCRISFPRMSSPTFFVGQSTDIQFQVTLANPAGIDAGSLQLFPVDANSQPAGAPLCNFTLSGTTADGSVYSCMVTFSRDTPGTIPLLVEATAGADKLLSPGFYVMAVAPMVDADVDNFYAVTDAATTAWQQNYATYGDTPQARIQTINALLGMDGVQEIRLLEDGLSIGVQFTSGVQYGLFLNRIGDAANVNANAKNAALTRSVAVRINQLPQTSDSGSATTCGSPKRPIVKNNGVLIWERS
jgi:hypothetical protein